MSKISKKIRMQADKLPTLQELFASDPSRVKRFTKSLDESFVIDFSKQPLTDEIFTQLMEFARESKVEEWRDRMFKGEQINVTEGRAVWHVSLRDPNCLTETKQALEKMLAYARKIRARDITHVVHIGIGGSHLGPEMAVKALRPFHSGPAIRFVANVDPADMSAALTGLDPKKTLFIVASKTFTTQETMANARTARTWLVNALGENAVQDHFAAASTNTLEVTNFGIDPANMFPFREWVGGRYSLWSSIGLPILLAVGEENFKALLSGAHEMDVHFKSAPIENNLPVLMAMTGILNRNFLHRSSLAILPYAQDLSLLVSFLQQLEMESNGKRVTREGEEIDWDTCPVIFGQPGSNGQHAFHQQLHQGPDIIPCDFIVPLKGNANDEQAAPGQHRLLVLNAFAQAAALMMGRKGKDAHRDFPGNRPSSTILIDALTPRSLGRLLALYEHKVAVQGWVWQINSFDQFGVELGKEMAKALEAGQMDGFDASTQALFARL